MNDNFKKDITNQVSFISRSLHQKDYGIMGAHWGELLAHSFYGYSLVNIYLQNNSDNQFRQFAVNELKFLYEYTNTDGKNKFIRNTYIPNGIIYQGHKNHLLVGLVMLGETGYKQQLYDNSDFIVKHLNQYLNLSAESYQGIAWFVDNIDAYYSLYLTDKIRIRDGLQPKYTSIITKWLEVVKNYTDKNGITLAEVYSDEIWNNQSRGCAAARLLTYLKEMDPNIFDQQYPLFSRTFEGDILGMKLIKDFPKGEEEINRFPAGPNIFGFSSSATVLSLALYKTANSQDEFYKLLKFLNFSLFYSKNTSKYMFGQSILINSLLLWGKTYVRWSEYIN